MVAESVHQESPRRYPDLLQSPIYCELGPPVHEE